VVTPSGVGSTRDTVNTMGGSGFKVVLAKIGNGPLGQCRVDSLRTGATVTGAVPDGDTVVNQLVDQTVLLNGELLRNRPQRDRAHRRYRAIR
jgi:hypothetical protein